MLCEGVTMKSEMKGFVDVAVHAFPEGIHL